MLLFGWVIYCHTANVWLSYYNRLVASCSDSPDSDLKGNLIAAMSLFCCSFPCFPYKFTIIIVNVVFCSNRRRRCDAMISRQLHHHLYVWTIQINQNIKRDWEERLCRTRYAAKPFIQSIDLHEVIYNFLLDLIDFLYTIKISCKQKITGHHGWWWSKLIKFKSIMIECDLYFHSNSIQ